MRKWLKFFIILIIFVAISALIYFILNTFGITNITTIRNWIVKTGPMASVIYVIITSLLLTFLCFVPILNSSLIVLAIVLFEIKTAFFLILFSTLLSNTFLFFIGRFGKKIAKKLVKAQDFNEIEAKITQKSKIILPILFVLPGIPDESLCLIAGITNIKYWYLILTSAIYHAIEIGLFCFVGSGIINWASLTILDWFLLINVLLFDILLIFKLEKNLK